MPDFQPSLCIYFIIDLLMQHVFCLCKVEVPKAVNDHYWCTRLEAEWFLCGPKMANWNCDGMKRTHC